MKANHQYIFTDIFDTCIFRKIHPYKVIEIWADELIFIYNINIDIKNLFKLRLKIYNDLLKDNEEIIYQQIIKEIFNYLKNNKMVDNKVLYDEFYETCHKIEIKVENKYQYINNKIIKYLKKQKNNGKRVVAVSDFYLSKQDIEQFMIHLGIRDVFDNIYVSSDYNKTKKNGSLYRLILNEEKCNTNECIMIGDNFISDRQNAKKNKIKAKYKPNRWQHIKNKLSLRVNLDIIKKYEMKKSINFLKKQKTPFLEYFLIFYEFTQRLYYKSKKDNIESLVFLAREGYFLKKLFDKYQKINIPKAQQIKTCYMKVSRTSIMNVSNNLLLNPLEKNCSIFNFINTLDLPKEKVKKILQIDNENFNKEIINFKDSKEYKSIINNKDIVDLYNKQHFSNVEAFNVYLKTFQSKNAAYVDVGWQGTMQKNISKVTLEDNVGYYIGVDRTWHMDDGIKTSGLMFSNNPKESKYYYFYRPNKQLYEMLLAAPHGSAISYSENNGIVQVKEKWEDNERNLYYNEIEILQKEMIQKFEYINIMAFGICRNFKLIDYVLSKMVVKSSLCNKKTYLQFLNKLDKGFVWNFGNESKGIEYSVKIKKTIQVFDMLKRPEKYLRYIVKIPRILYNKHLVILSYFIVWPYYAYTKINFKMRNVIAKK